jgi:DNA-binding PadR family transcriptional regulator
MPTPTHPEDFGPLTPAVLHILLALADGEKHGYAIGQDVLAMTNGQVRMGPGTLYGTLNRMVESRLIAPTGERPDPEIDKEERRRYFRVTDFGQRVLQAEVSRLRELIRVADSKAILGGTS